MKVEQLREVFLSELVQDGVYLAKKLRGKKDLVAQIENTSIGDLRTLKEKVYGLLSGNYLRPRCICGTETPLKTTVQGFSKFCSNKCSAASEETREERKKTNREKYGVDNVFQSETKKQKIKETMLERYGADHTFKIEKHLQKRKQTYIENYGVDNPMQNLQIQEKIKKTNLDKYGVEYANSNLEVKQKKIKTVLDRYGVVSILQIPDIRDAIRRTNLEKYGHTVAMHSETKKVQVAQKRYERYKQFVLPSRLNALAELNIFPDGWTLDDYSNQDIAYKFMHTDCGTKFTGKFSSGGTPLCPTCKKHRSAIEQKLFNALEETFPNIQKNDRTSIAPCELDIVIGGVAIEVNGVYWHSEAANRKMSLLEKTEAFNGQLLHFWDYELFEHFDICVSMIKSKLGIFDRRVYARKGTIKTLTSDEARLFFNNNHLQGFIPATYYIGIILEGEIVQAIAVGRSRFRKNINLELFRAATAKNVQVIGGTSRLIAALGKLCPGKTLISYADRRYSTGGGYLAAGFLQERSTAPGYYWVKGTTRLQRHQTQKHKLPAVLSNFDDALSETENMLAAGYHKLIDCGHLVFTLKL